VSLFPPQLGTLRTETEPAAEYATGSVGHTSDLGVGSQDVGGSEARPHGRAGAERPSSEGADPAGLDPHWAPASVLEACGGALANIGGSTATSIAVTSCHRGEGRSTVASALAYIERTSYDRRTLLVELDVERPSVADALGLDRAPGVGEIVRGEARLEPSLQWTPENLAVLTAGEARQNPEALLARVIATDILGALGELFEVLVVDLPPLEGTGSAAQLAGRCSTPLLVVRAGAAEMRDLKKAVAMFRVPPPIIMNGVTSTSAEAGGRRAR
jgi:Mrp family chromosome partitioning ATPase